MKLVRKAPRPRTGNFWDLPVLTKSCPSALLKNAYSWIQWKKIILRCDEVLVRFHEMTQWQKLARPVGRVGYTICPSSQFFARYGASGRALFHTLILIQYLYQVPACNRCTCICAFIHKKIKDSKRNKQAFNLLVNHYMDRLWMDSSWWIR